MDEINGLLKRLEAHEKERERETGLGLYTTNNNTECITYGMYTDTVNKSYGVYGSTSSWAVSVDPTIMERIEPVETKEGPYVANAQKICSVRVKVFSRKEYPSSTSFEDDINDFLDYLHDNGLKGSLTMHADVVYIAYESNR